MRYVVDIDQLVLRGIDVVDRRGLSAGLREELGSLLTRECLAPDLSSRDRVETSGMKVTPGDDHATGRSIARSVLGGLGR